MLWLCRHAGFPAHRLPSGAELLVLFAAAAEAETTVAGSEAKVVRSDHSRDASQRQLAENRRHAHFKSNNRVKV